MDNTSLQQQLLEAGVHFGHLKKKWNPKMLPYIFAEKKGIHIIDLNKSVEGLQDAANALKAIARSGKKIMFVATKKQAKELVTECAQKVNMPYVTERWLGGMLTNFNTVRKSVKKMQSIDKMLTDVTSENLNKKERLTLTRERDKMEKVLGGIANISRVPHALFMVDTNCDPGKVDFPIPANDDASKSIAIIVNYITAAIAEGLAERQANKDEDNEQELDETAEEKAARFEKQQEDGDDKGRRGGGGRGPGAGGGARKRTTTGGGGGGRKPAAGGSR